MLSHKRKKKKEKDLQNDNGMGLTFRKAFFSNVFMINGGMAVIKTGPFKSSLNACLQLRFP